MKHTNPVTEGHSFKLTSVDPADTGKYKSEGDVAERVKEDLDRLYHLHYRMFAENRHSLLVILQGIDASGKDGAVRHIFAGANPQGCRVFSFKQPTELELRHDFLWRVHQAVPERGVVAIFNRSHYEEVMTVKVHPEYLENERLPVETIQDSKIFEKRYEQIRQFEKMLHQNGTMVVKFLLHISKAEQKRRLEERLQDATKNWKFSESDVRERKFWNAYQKAFSEAIAETSTKHAPWYVIPSDHKWYRNFLVSCILVKTLEEVKMKWPRIEHRGIKIP